jgi:20S proteasome subunit alpha 3
MEHINNDGTVVGILAKDGKWLLTKKNCALTKLCNLGVVLAAEKKEFSALFVPMRESGKLYKMDNHIICSISGVVADANFLVDYGRVHSQRHLYQMQQPIMVEQLVKYTSNYKHSYT